MKVVGLDGVCSTKQALGAGLTMDQLRWLVRSGRWMRLRRGVYLMHPGPPTWHQRARGVLLAAGPGTALSHHAAAFVLRLEGLGSAPPERLDVTVQRWRWPLRDAPDVEVHRAQAPLVTVVVDGLRVTGLVRTLMDLSHHVEPEVLEFALDSARLRFPRLESWLERALRHALHGTRGAGLLRELVTQRNGHGVESPLEARVRRALVRARLPPPVTQLEVRDGGQLIMRVDFAWPRQRVALHVDGYAWHLQRQRFERDAAQRSELTRLGWRSVFVTQASLESDRWLDQLRGALGRGGRAAEAEDDGM